MIQQLLNAYEFNLKYAFKLIEDVPSEDAGQAGGPGLENSPLFSIGHLVTGAGITAASFHGVNTVAASIRELFQRRGPNDQRVPEIAHSPFSLRDLIDELVVQHGLVQLGILNCAPEKWDAPHEWRLQQYFPTFADATWFMCVTHEAIHLGQIAAWRRWYGLPSAMAKM